MVALSFKVVKDHPYQTNKICQTEDTGKTFSKICPEVRESWKLYMKHFVVCYKTKRLYFWSLSVVISCMKFLYLISQINPQ